jgi:hypothetical protein
MRAVQCLGYIVPGVALLGMAAYVLGDGRVLGRSGFTSLSHVSHPVAFWVEVGSFAGIGLLLVIYGSAKWLNVARTFTGALDQLSERVVSRFPGRRHGP